MAKLTIFIYRWFKSHKIVFYGLLLLSTVFFTFFSTKIYFEEDISKLLPAAEEGGAEELVFSNLKVKDKIFILFNTRSSSMEPDQLINVCDSFTQTLLEQDTVYDAIHNILYRVEVSVLQNGIRFLYENAPLFLESSHYQQLDSLLTPEKMNKQMAENYSLLRSPAGRAYREVITHDPIALRKIFLSEAGGGMGNGLGGNYAFYNNHIFTADTTICLAFLSPNFKAFDSKQGIRLSDMIEKQIKSFQEQNPDIEILYHGAPVQSVYNSRQIKKDLLVTISFSLVLIFIILLFCFKNKSTIIYLVLPVVYGVIFALSVMYFIKGSMSLMAMGIGAIVMGVAFSYCMHVITHYKYVSDPVEVLKDQTVPVILGSLTTIGAFMGLLFTQSELLQDFGLFASLGLVGTTLFCLLFLPQFFRPENNRRSEKAFTFLEKINSFPFDKQKWLLVFILAITVICFITSRNVKFDSDLRNIGYNDDRVMRSRELLESKTSNNFSTIYFASISADQDSALIYNRQLSQLMDKEIECKRIHGYSASASIFIPTAEQQERIRQWNEYWTDEKKRSVQEMIIQAGNKYKFTEKNIYSFLPDAGKKYQPVSIYESGVIPEMIMENIIEYTDGRYLVFTPVQMNREQLMEVGNDVVAQNPNLIVIDPMYYINDMVKLVHEDFSTTLAISSIFVLLVLLASYRNIPLALIAFLPMGLSWYIVLGCMAIFGMEFNLINIVISTFVFGIGVDYSIFIMDGLLAPYKGTRSSLLVYHKTAIFFSAVILIIVTASLLFAVHPAIASIGVATLIGMGATILIAYTLLPFLFSLLVRYLEKRGKTLFSSRKKKA
ncbi:MAG: MMPL family transporter [Bacteroides sp.]|nr:MMPL family transporter [Bacteroides sp.]